MLYSKITTQIEGLAAHTLSKERQATLQPLIDFIQSKIDQKANINLNFICTHNSRRSHLSQVWAQTMAAYYKIDRVACYSAGTEATALFPVAAKTLEHTGFYIQTIAAGSNPVYSIKYGENASPIIGFSKTIEAPFNPSSEFAAIMTCSSADQGCPVLLGAEKRIPLTYEDPKAFDHTPQQMEKYQERSLQIATEMKYVFANLNNH